MENLLLFCVSAFGFIILIAFIRAVRVVQQYEKGIVLRLGKFAGLADPGITFLIPFIDSLIKVDMRELVINVPPQQVITEDNVTVNVDAVVYYTRPD
jgi:regulator of protease activity HflC (stomatin/prohibitin superfamily)